MCCQGWAEAEISLKIIARIVSVGLGLVSGIGAKSWCLRAFAKLAHVGVNGVQFFKRFFNEWLYLHQKVAGKSGWPRIQNT